MGHDDITSPIGTRRVEETWSHEPRAGESIGPYKLLERLGEGGFGVVWLAERREPMVQRVALKIIKPGMDSKGVIARFEQERQALAVMDHPNVARVFDGGVTERGLPYFVMEHVKGEPITTFCDAHRYTIRQRLELFTHVCEAVQHAHHKGIIHRDLKPSNVLVTIHEGHATPKVIDFGVAKAISHTLTDKTIFTESGQLIGTPEYMSPEQAEMRVSDIDTRTDVFSLGVILYELLSGTLPLDAKTLRSAGYGEIQRIIRNVDPPRPSVKVASTPATLAEVAQCRRTEAQHLAGSLRGELDWIVMRAMEKERQRRYDSPAHLGDDVRRFLGGEAVLAAPPSTWYRVRTLARRHRVATLAGAGVGCALVLGVLGTGIGLVEARRERASALAAAERATSAERLATARLAESQATVDFLDQMLAAADPGEKGKDVTVRAIMDQSAGQIATRYADRPLVAARLHTTIGRTYSGLGLFERAEPHVREAHAIRLRELGPTSEETCQSANDLLALELTQGKPDVEASIQNAVRTHEAQFGRKHPVTLQTLDTLAQLYATQNRPTEAAAIAREVLDERLKSPGRLHPDTIRVMNTLAVSCGDMGKIDDAERLYKDLIDAQAQLSGPEHPHALSLKGDVAWMLYWTSMDRDGGTSDESKERLQRSRVLGEQVLEARLRVLGEEHKDTLTSMSNLALVYKQLGMKDRAESMTRRALDVSVRVLGEEHPDTIVSLANMGAMLRGNGRCDEAIAFLERAIAASRKVLPPDNPGTAYSLGWYGACLAKLGRFTESEAALLEARGIIARVQGEGSRTAGQMSKDLADLYTAWDKAEPGKGHDAKAAEWKAKSETTKSEAAKGEANEDKK